MGWKKLGNPTPRDIFQVYEPFAWKANVIQNLSIPESVKEISFNEVISARRSARVFEPISLGDLSSLLWITSRVEDSRPSRFGFELTRRPSPSAGAIHPIHILIRLNDEFWWRYEAFSHALVRVDEEWLYQDKMLQEIKQVLDPGNGHPIFFLAEPGKTEAKYLNHDSLVWRDAGVILGIMSLASEALGLTFSPLGITGESWAESLDQKGRLMGVGLAIIGGPSS